MIQGIQPKRSITGLMFVLMLTAMAMTQAAGDKILKPFILGHPQAGNMAQVVNVVESALGRQGFTIVGRYSPFKGATVIAASHPELTAAASKTVNGGFGAAQRVSVTEVKGKLQVVYMNPEYLGTAYGMGPLTGVSARLKKALGAVKGIGSKGVSARKLAPGKYHYAMFMPYFKDISRLNKFSDYKTALATVEKNLAAGAGGTKKIYRIDLPGKEVSVFGVAIPEGDGPNSGKKDTDKEVLDIIDFRDVRSTAYLPYELMVQGKEVIALRGRYRIAVHFPDTRMAGKHGFTKIMSSPGGIKAALEAIAGYKK